LKATPKGLFINHKTLLILYKLYQYERRLEYNSKLKTDPEKETSDLILVDYICQKSETLTFCLQDQSTIQSISQLVLIISRLYQV